MISSSQPEPGLGAGLGAVGNSAPASVGNTSDERRAAVISAWAMSGFMPYARDPILVMMTISPGEVTDVKGKNGSRSDFWISLR